MLRPRKSLTAHPLCRRRVYLLPFVCLILFSALFNGLPAAQSQQPQSDAPPMQQRPRRVASSPPQDDDEILRVETDLVLVDVSVTDAAGRPVRNLRAEDFKIYDEGVERPIAFFNVEKQRGAPRPVAIVFAVDVSGSMSSK